MRSSSDAATTPCYAFGAPPCKQAYQKYDDVCSAIDEKNKLAGYAAKSMLRQVGVLAPRFKHRAFKEEREWRIVAIPRMNREAKVVKFRTSAQGAIVPYMEIPFREEERRLASITKVFAGPLQAGSLGAVRYRAPATAFWA